MKRSRTALTGVLLTALPALLALTSTSCVTRASSDSLQKEIAALQDENFRLRKDLAEARVRLEMAREADTRPLAPPSRAAAPPAKENPLGSVAPASDATPRVIYSEPITPEEITRGTAASGAGGVVSAAGSRLDLARQKLDARDPEGALVVFRSIATGQPDDPLADDAQFGAGECYFAMGRYEEAIAEYRMVINTFPFGDQVPFAFLKIGFAHLALDQRDLALDNFRSVSEAYPGTEAATVARQQIAHLKASQR